MRLAVIIPTLNAGGHLPGLLHDLEAGRAIIAEIIVSDGGSADDTANLARQAGAVSLSGPPGRGGQLRRGVAAAQAEWLWLLHADSRLPPDWPKAVAACCETVPANSAWYGKLRFNSHDPRARLLEGGVALRCALARLPYGDQGLLIHQALLDEIGGIPDLPLMEDVVLARRLRARLRPMSLVITTSAAAYERDGWLRRAAVNFWRLARFLFGASAAKLAKGYRR
ncbi:TIGR04283 family arsenosugar biosynthesis glycosyltransferase [Acidocella sp.]|uniref:TIGR04283 family arsenosugar biosynthesis glycosyltransferase n=1 Tax=Acidocella sp. TaxID=50710 RepID=UPI0026229377|nr:TIGR04283 family arsenosugar biosynthesis glycosyltransferase [Acidocella sp.]